MHDSFTPLGGLVPLLNIELGEVIFGGVGAGLYGMIIYIVIAVFIAGLMVGRTPEFLGKKIEPYDIKMASFVILILAFCHPWLFGLGKREQDGAARSCDRRTHRRHEQQRAARLQRNPLRLQLRTGNNGSAFAGLTANAPWYDTTLGLATLFGRFAMIVPILALAGSLGRKKLVAESAGTFPVSGPLFTGLLVGTVLLVGALTFVPALVLGPVVEHFLMHAGKLF